MKKLLLPYAYDSTGNLVHIDNAHKGETYKCPKCDKVLSLNISKIPEGQKYHRRNHFSHPKGYPDNQCTESFLHKLFKKRAADCIQKKIYKGDNEFLFTWNRELTHLRCLPEEGEGHRLARQAIPFALRPRRRLHTL